MAFVLSYPGPTWHIRGAYNFRSAARAEVNPRAALREWLAFADVLSARGARLAVLAPPAVEPPLTGLLYAANYGATFSRSEGPVLLLSRMSVPHRTRERSFVQALAESLGLETRESRAVWEGQAEICALPRGRYLLTWGVRSDQASVVEITTHLPQGARVLPLKLREPFFHGDTCLNAIPLPDGRTILLAYPGAFVDANQADLERFCAPDVELVPVSEADALAYACNALPLGKDLVAARGLSAELASALAARGLTLVEVDFTELFGKGGGGPRCLVNDLGAADLPVPAYESWRASLEASVAGYPEVTSRTAPSP